MHSPILQLSQMLFVNWIDQDAAGVIVRRGHDNVTGVIIPFYLEGVTVCGGKVVEMDLGVVYEVGADLRPVIVNIAVQPG